ncbi:MAG: hypothetical protein ACK5HY_09925 [Parahaliea sp.]
MTIRVIAGSVLRVAREYGLGGLKAQAAVSQATGCARMSPGSTTGSSLLDEGPLSRLAISVGGINRDFEAAGDPPVAKRPEEGPGDDVFIEMFAAQMSA